MLSSQMWFCVTMLSDRIRRRIGSARGAEPESGALTLEWIVIAGILVAAAVLAGLAFSGAISHFESDLTSGG